MEKIELIKLLTTSQEKRGQLRLKENEKRRKEILLKELEEEYEISMSPVYTDGSKSTVVNSKVENVVINKDTRVSEIKARIKQLDKEIELLKLDIEEVDVRLGCLTRIENAILVDRFVNEMSLEDIGIETYSKLRSQTRSAKTIKRIVENALKKMEKI